MTARPIPRRYAYLFFFTGYFLGGWIQRLVDQRRYDHAAKKMEEDKRTHISCKVTFANGDEAAYAIRTDSFDDASAFMHNTGYMAGRSGEEGALETLPDGVKETPDNQRPVTANFTLNISGDVDPGEIQESVIQALQFSDLTSGRPVTINASGDGVIVSPPIMGEFSEAGEFVTPPTSAEARDYLERERWTGA